VGAATAATVTALGAGQIEPRDAVGCPPPAASDWPAAGAATLYASSGQTRNTACVGIAPPFLGR
jgi:hypothetical protein